MNYENEAGVYARPERLVEFRTSHRMCSVKKSFYKKIRKFRSKAPVLESLFNKFAGLQT